eukprot:9717463-Ditylum_brightwellii.AAC.1
MDYLTTYPNAVLRFFAGNMQPHVNLFAAYLVFNGTKAALQAISTVPPTHTSPTAITHCAMRPS